MIIRLQSTKSNVRVYIKLDVLLLIDRSKKYRKQKRHEKSNVIYAHYPIPVGFTEEEWNDWNKHSYLGRGRREGGEERGT